jgi:hypothetical protein
MSRQGAKWTINEELSLHREVDLLKISIEDIATKHQRSCMSIVYKLQSEGLVSDITVEQYKLKNKNNKKGNKDEELDVLSYDNDSSSDYVDDGDISEEDSDSEYEVEKTQTQDSDSEDEYADMPDLVDADDISEVDKLTDRVWSLETSVNQIGNMVKTLFDQLSSNKKTSKKKKLSPLRKSA